jgi:hypothetical protein
VVGRLGGWGGWDGDGAYHGEGLDAEHKGVRGQVARVGEGVFLPQLGEEVLGGGDGGVVADEVTWVGYQRRSREGGNCGWEILSKKRWRKPPGNMYGLG